MSAYGSGDYGTGTFGRLAEPLEAPYTSLPTGGFPDGSLTGGEVIVPSELGGRPTSELTGGYPVASTRVGGYPDGTTTFGFPVDLSSGGEARTGTAGGFPPSAERSGRPRERRTWGQNDSET